MWFDRSIDLTLKTPTWVALFQSDRSRFRLVWFSSCLITLIIGGLLGRRLVVSLLRLEN